VRKLGLQQLSIKLGIDNTWNKDGKWRRENGR